MSGRASRSAAATAPERRLGAVRGRWWRAAHGQAAVELVALLPLVVAVVFGILQALAAGLASELAGHAAQSAAVAIAEGGDGAAAARAAVPGWSLAGVHVDVRGSQVRVRLIPPSLLPGLGERLAATAIADAGPAS